MNAIPAVIAGVQEIAMTTPCSSEGRIAPEVLVAAAECGIHEVYRIGGAQAIAALAYGTESIRKVDKITGPGNAYVAAAKRLVFGAVGIDTIAGPTEIVVVADLSADPRFVAADLLAQAEHDELASPICIVTSAPLAAAVDSAVSDVLASAPRRAIARKAFDGQGVIIIVRRTQDAINIVNHLAPEHCELMIKNARVHAAKVTNAGSIFVGPWSTEALGDYSAGPNHTLPTAGAARFSSPLGVADFMKFTNVIEVSRAGFERLAPGVETLARVEGLHGHAASVAVRRNFR
jgi:histidinol dehydrogenase